MPQADIDKNKRKTTKARRIFEADTGKAPVDTEAGRRQVSKDDEWLAKKKRELEELQQSK